MKRISIIQSSYIPWRGLFDLISRCDLYVIFDEAQFVKRHWHNRNRIKGPDGGQWLTIPVLSKSRFTQPIEDVEINDRSWAERHWRTIELNYRRASNFAATKEWLAQIYEEVSRETSLTAVNERFIRALTAQLGASTTIERDRGFCATGSKTDRILDICIKASATHYISGPSARSYLEVEKFNAVGIEVEWMSYEGYPSYPQCWGTFDPAVSILDLLMNVRSPTSDLWRSGAARE